MKVFDRDSVIRPGLFGSGLADTRRGEFDWGNESLLAEGVRPDAVFIGDSLIHHWELQAYFAGDGRVLINRGIGGDVSKDMRRRFEADALQLKPRLIVMMIGTNDLGWGAYVVPDYLVDRVCENIKAMLDSARQAGIPTAIGSILPIERHCGFGSERFTKIKNAKIVDANRRIEAIAKEYGAAYVDFHSRMVDENGDMRIGLTDDGVHPHSVGRVIMVDALREALANAGIGILA